MNRFHDADTIKSLVFQAIGAGSVCWENPGGAGVFDSTKAKELGDEAVERLKQIIGPLAHQLADISQIVTEHEIDSAQFSDQEWWAKLRIAIDGSEYR